MKFGIFYEHQLPRPWEEDAERRLFQEALDQCEFADRLGFDYVWGVEHHFMEEYSHSSAPEVFLAAASQRTRHMRLGHGIIQTPPSYNHPVRTAERLATLDLVSNGRVEFGSGESSSAAEILGFGMNPEEKYAQWREGLEVTIRCMMEVPFTGVDGRFVQIPPRNVVPKPVQKPHPPLWLACTRRESILRAAQHGMGALTFAFIDPEDAAHWVRDYERAIAEQCVPIGEAVNPAVACATTVMCHSDEREALRRGLEGANFFGYALGHYYVYGEHRPGRTDVWSDFQHQRSARGYDPEIELALQSETLGAKLAAGETSGLRGAVGTPEQLRRYLRRYEEAGVDQIIFVQQSGRNRHEHIMESLELLAREVLPEFIERDAARRDAKRISLEPAIARAFTRRSERIRPSIEDYAIDAFPRHYVKEERLRELASKASIGED